MSIESRKGVALFSVTAILAAGNLACGNSGGDIEKIDTQTPVSQRDVDAAYNSECSINTEPVLRRIAGTKRIFQLAYPKPHPGCLEPETSMPATMGLYDPSTPTSGKEVEVSTQDTFTVTCKIFKPPLAVIRSQESGTEAAVTAGSESYQIIIQNDIVPECPLPQDNSSR